MFKITTITMKLFGTKGTIYRVWDAAGELVHINDTREGAEAWIAAQ